MVVEGLRHHLWPGCKSCREWAAPQPFRPPCWKQQGALSYTSSLCDEDKGFPEFDLRNVFFPLCFSIISSKPSVIGVDYVASHRVNDSKKCLLSPCLPFCHNVMTIPLEIRLWSSEFKHLFTPGDAIWVHSARRWQRALQSPCSLWNLLVFNRLEETWLSSPIPAAEMLSKVVISPLVLLEGRIFLEKRRLCCRDDHRWLMDIHRDGNELGSRCHHNTWQIYLWTKD